MYQLQFKSDLLPFATRLPLLSLPLFPVSLLLNCQMSKAKKQKTKQ